MANPNPNVHIRTIFYTQTVENKHLPMIRIIFIQLIPKAIDRKHHRTRIRLCSYTSHSGRGSMERNQMGMEYCFGGGYDNFIIDQSYRDAD